MTHQNPYPAPSRPKKSKMHVWLIAIGAVLGLCVLGGVIAGIASSGKSPAKPTQGRNVVSTSLPSDPCGGGVCTSEPTTAPTSDALTKKDVKLSVKITDKACFGSAGCNLQWQIKAATDLAKVKQSSTDWEVTYEVRGVDDGPQINTLTLHPDGTYDQDSYQAGETPRSSTRLTAVVTDVEPA